MSQSPVTSACLPTDRKLAAPPTGAAGSLRQERGPDRSGPYDKGNAGRAGSGPYDKRMPGTQMVFLGFGKYVRADRIYALEPIVGEERGSGSRTLVWVDGIPEPIVASRTQETILEELDRADPTPRRGRRGRSELVRHPQLFDPGA